MDGYGWVWMGRTSTSESTRCVTLGDACSGTADIPYICQSRGSLVLLYLQLPIASNF